jgi:hypothetical protein
MEDIDGFKTCGKELLIEFPWMSKWSCSMEQHQDEINAIPSRYS